MQDLLAPDVAIIAASKGLEKHTGLMMSDLIPSALGRHQPAVFISGPSFAKEIVKNMPTALVAAAKVRSLTWCFMVCQRVCSWSPGALMAGLVRAVISRLASPLFLCFNSSCKRQSRMAWSWGLQHRKWPHDDAVVRYVAM